LEGMSLPHLQDNHLAACWLATAWFLIVSFYYKN